MGKKSLICLEGKSMTLEQETLFSSVPPSSSLMSVLSIGGSFEQTTLQGPQLALYVASETAENQGHCRVCRTRRRSQYTVKNNWRKPWLCVWWKNTCFCYSKNWRAKVPSLLHLVPLVPPPALNVQLLTSRCQEYLYGCVLKKVSPAENGSDLVEVPFSMKMVAILQYLKQKKISIKNNCNTGKYLKCNILLFLTTSLIEKSHSTSRGIPMENWPKQQQRHFFPLL